MQVKKNMWYNIRPDSVKNWYNKEKTFHKFIEQIIKCIELCPHIEDKKIKITNIKSQYKLLIAKYAL
jgi:predicted metal-dependent hydrolase